MKNFKQGQKVVFSTYRLRTPRDFFEASFPRFILPKENEVVTILCNGDGPNFWVLEEYKRNKLGIFQAIDERLLFPIEEISARETERITADLEKDFAPIEITPIHYKNS